MGGGVADPIIASRTQHAILRDRWQRTATDASRVDEALDLASRLAKAAEVGPEPERPGLTSPRLPTSTGPTPARATSRNRFAGLTNRRLEPRSTTSTSRDQRRLLTVAVATPYRARKISIDVSSDNQRGRQRAAGRLELDIHPSSLHLTGLRAK